ncbi:hypothetical protein Syun_026833 [Stephania yunnanensis]|uniref:Uncharacterized protein n=1 Tax=Stephania yunnanensis TaxID=152371 RepID=A0AAP0EJJ3_9MAGN
MLLRTCHLPNLSKVSFFLLSIHVELISKKSQTPLQDKAPPLVGALKTSAEQDVACFHFPGHIAKLESLVGAYTKVGKVGRYSLQHPVLTKLVGGSN